MGYRRTCCKNCANKMEKKLDSNSIMLYCDIKKKRVNPDGLCQWHISDFRDYDVRVWSGDVFINSHKVIGYSGGRSGECAQTPTDDKQLHGKIMDACRNIAEEFLKLDALINEAKD